MQNFSLRRIMSGIAPMLVLAGCTSARWAHVEPGCDATPELVAQVRYKPDPERPSLIDVQCARCDDVYVAAQHEWLRKTFPIQRWVEHYSAAPTVGPGESPYYESCFVIPVEPNKTKTVCFTNFGRCDREAS